MIAACGNNPSVASEVTVFPEPDSPTTATLSPFPISNDTHLIACTIPFSVLKSICRSLTDSRGVFTTFVK